MKKNQLGIQLLNIGCHDCPLIIILAGLKPIILISVLKYIHLS